MKKITFLPFAFMAMAAMFFTSCGNHVFNGDGYIDIETFEAQANFDLTSRKDWSLTLFNVEYDATINGNKITGIPAVYPLSMWPHNNIILAVFQHPELMTNEQTEQQIKTKIQNTKDKLMMYDKLEAVCNVAVNITDGKFKHQETLLEFTVDGLPEGAEVYLIERNDITVWPYQDEEKPNLYQTIVSSMNTYKSLKLNVQTSDGVYSQIIELTKSTVVDTRMALNYEKPALTSIMFTFDAKIETKEDDTLSISIENLIADTTGKWSIE